MTEKTYRFIYRHNRKAFLNLLAKQIKDSSIDPYHIRNYELSDPVDPDHTGRGIGKVRGQLRISAEATWHAAALVWRRLRSPRHDHAVLYVTRPDGRYIIMRNGGNLSSYNFVIITPDLKYHWAANAPEAVETVCVLSAPARDLPLLLNTKKAYLRKLVLNRLKEV